MLLGISSPLVYTRRAARCGFYFPCRPVFLPGYSPIACLQHHKSPIITKNPRIEPTIIIARMASDSGLFSLSDRQPPIISALLSGVHVGSHAPDAMLGSENGSSFVSDSCHCAAKGWCMVTIIVVVASVPLRVSSPGLGAKLVGSLSQRCDGRLGCSFPAYVKPLENNTRGK